MSFIRIANTLKINQKALSLRMKRGLEVCDSKFAQCPKMRENLSPLCLSLSLFIHLPVCRSLSLCLSICQSVALSLSVYPSVCLSVCLSVSLSHSLTQTLSLSEPEVFRRKRDNASTVITWTIPIASSSLNASISILLSITHNLTALLFFFPSTHPRAAVLIPFVYF